MPNWQDLNAFAPRVGKVQYKMSYLEKESRQKYKNFGRYYAWTFDMTMQKKILKYSLRT